MPTRRLFIGLALAFSLAGCQTPSPTQKLPQMTFQHLPVWRLDVGQVMIQSDFKSPMRAPHIEHLAPVSPEEAVRRWAAARLQPVGLDGAVRVVVRDARLTETPLQVTQGVKGAFTKDQAARFDVVLDVAVQVIDQRQMPVAEAVAQAARNRSIPEGTTLNDRDRILYEMVEGAMMDLNAQLDPLIGQFMARWVK
ncbi:MAG: hypothetical protein HQL40_20160 [Alphaproteobacteria bacterium]|nr:hypothetical protein [Alphaproteobacteria bacterium]